MLLAKTRADEARLKEVMRKIQCENMFVYPRTLRGGGSMFFWGLTIHVTVEVSGTNYIDALFQEDDRVGIGLIIRDCQGRAWHRVEIIPLPLTVMDFETLATLSALQLVVDLSLIVAIPEGDSTSLSLISFSLFSHKVKRFATLSHCFRFPHVRKERNSVAHNLVRHARHVTGFQVWIEDVPSHTIAIYLAILLTN